MFAGLNRRQTKTAPASDRTAKADVARNTKNPNSVWQSLATRTTGLQAKLTVSQPGDPYELEADRVADRIMRMETPSSHAGRLSFSSLNGSTAQRKCDQCDEEEKQVQRKENGVGSNAVDGAPPSVSQTLSSTGQPLDSPSRSFFEPHFGRDFRDVRIHTDARAAESARAVNARAYTVGQNIVFGAGQYVPSTGSGRHLLAHELSHVCQQTNPPHAGEASMSDRPTSRLSRVTNTVQRQTGDPFTDPFGEGKKEEKKPELDPTSKRAYEDCPEMCQKFPVVEIAPDVFVAMCDDSVLMNGPDVRTGGCSPNRQGRVGLFTGTPGWQVPARPDACNFHTCNVKKPASAAGIEIGYIQTVQDCLSGGVYFKKDASGQWVWAGNKWCCVKNARDGMVDSVEPWYGAPGNFGPKPFEGDCPAMADTPNITLPARQNTTQIDRGVEGGGNPLRRLRIDGTFHLWLVAMLPNGSLVFIHHWSFRSWIVAVLDADDADPCNISQWKKMGRNELITSGPGKGGATPVLTGDVANIKAQDCSAPSSTGNAASKEKQSCNMEKKPEKAAQ